MEAQAIEEFIETLQLKGIECSQMWELEGTVMGSSICGMEGWLCNATVVVFQKFMDGTWEVFVPVSRTLDMEEVAKVIANHIENDIGCIQGNG